MRRTDYASGCWVGAHVDKIVEHSDKVCFVVDLYLIILLQPQIAEVLVEMPDAHNGFQEVCHLLRRLQPLLKARRFLDEQAPAGSRDIPGSRDFFKIPIPGFSKI